MKHCLRFRVSWVQFPVMPRRLLFLFFAVALSGCVHVTMDPIEVHAVVDVNVKVDKALDDFFGDLDKKSTTAVVRPPAKS